MRILQLTKKYPYPAKDGEAIAIVNLSKSLTEAGAAVTLLAMNTSKHRVDVAQVSADFLAIYEKVYDVKIFNHITVWGAFKNLFERESYHITRFISKDYEAKIVEILRGGHFDVVLLETLFLTPYIEAIRAAAPNVRIVLRTHNVEHEIWQRVAEVTPFLPKRWYIKFLNKKLRRLEVENIAKCDLLLPITERDLQIFRNLGYQGAALATPVGLNAADYKPNFTAFNAPHKTTFSFIGSLDWMPNQEGLRWFLDEVWLKKGVYTEGGVLHIAGRNAPQWLQHIDTENVIFYGEIEDAHAFMNSCAVSVVPLFSGGGIRVKILEAMLLGRVVISTSMGLEGINATDGENVLIADDATSFAEKMRFCLQNPEKMQEISQNAMAFVRAHFDNQNIAKKVLAAMSADRVTI